MPETTFCELRCKEVINITDGRKLGCIIDIVFESCSGKVLGFVVPGEKRFFAFKPKQDVFIPFRSICKIGEDVILIDVKYNEGENCRPFEKDKRHHKDGSHGCSDKHGHEGHYGGPPHICG